MVTEIIGNGKGTAEYSKHPPTINLLVGYDTTVRCIVEKEVKHARNTLFSESTGKETDG